MWKTNERWHSSGEAVEDCFLGLRFCVHAVYVPALQHGSFPSIRREIHYSRRNRLPTYSRLLTKRSTRSLPMACVYLLSWCICICIDWVHRTQEDALNKKINWHGITINMGVYEASFMMLWNIPVVLLRSVVSVCFFIVYSPSDSQLYKNMWYNIFRLNTKPSD